MLTVTASRTVGLSAKYLRIHRPRQHTRCRVETGPGGLSHGFQEPPVCGRVPRSQGHEISGGNVGVFVCVYAQDSLQHPTKSVVIEEGKVFYGVDEDGQIFHFTPSSTTTSPPMFTTNGIVEPNPENRNDWFLFEGVMCRGKIVWRWPDAISWKVVRGLEELQHQHIIKICSFSDKTIAIFWEAPQQQGLLELWYAEISMERYKVNEGWWEVWGNIESSAAVLSHSSSHTSSFNLLYVATVFA
ncbi:hypothetical protein F2Q68_00013271 [Brassica cretica]|uniref:Uncharacterized protein n=1 Tax=Brassica cretica TaxID=69181 RepID=A0A8S9HM66_BRACR|nr:hypothetical protein F2Q68_00013271 [Brassica cretica]